ncbi:hypothetical protein SCALM49S_05616 [Streptomyces californicus]
MPAVELAVADVVTAGAQHIAEPAVLPEEHPLLETDLQAQCHRPPFGPRVLPGEPFAAAFVVGPPEGTRLGEREAEAVGAPEGGERGGEAARALSGDRRAGGVRPGPVLPLGPGQEGVGEPVDERAAAREVVHAPPHGVDQDRHGGRQLSVGVQVVEDVADAEDRPPHLAVEEHGERVRSAVPVVAGRQVDGDPAAVDLGVERAPPLGSVAPCDA